MSGNSIFLDTNIVLYLLSGDKTLIPLLEDKLLYISFITELELLSYKKLSRNDNTQIRKFLTKCIIIDINGSIKELTINFRKRFNLKLPDSIIAATAMYLDVPLITADNQFKSVKDINLLYYEK